VRALVSGARERREGGGGDITIINNFVLASFKEEGSPEEPLLNHRVPTYQGERRGGAKGVGSCLQVNSKGERKKKKGQYLSLNNNKKGARRPRDLICRLYSPCKQKKKKKAKKRGGPEWKKKRGKKSGGA